MKLNISGSSFVSFICSKFEWGVGLYSHPIIMIVNQAKYNRARLQWISEEVCWLLQIPVSAVGMTTLTLPAPQLTTMAPVPVSPTTTHLQLQDKSICVTEQCGNNQVHCQVRYSLV